MSRFCVLALACAGGFLLTAAPAFADPRPGTGPKKEDDATEIILTTITTNEVNFEKNINEVPLIELLQDLSKTHKLVFAINEPTFKQYGQPNIKEAKADLAATQLRGLKLYQFLNVVLESMGATYLVKNNCIEIVPIQHAAKVTKVGLEDQDENGRGRLKEPLVSAIVKEKPLNETVAKIAEMYDLTVVVLPQAGDARTGFVTTRLLNVPADKALELLALQCDLRVVRRGATFVITSKDHANELFEEAFQKELKKIELQKLRNAKPEKAPAPEPPPTPKPAEKPADLLLPPQKLPVAPGK